MALIVEDNTGLSNANAYISLSELESYATERNEPIDTYTLAQKEAAIVVASVDFTDGSFTFRGEKLNENQSMSLPTDDVIIDAIIKRAVSAAAMLHLKGRLFVAPEDITARQVQSESGGVGSLSDSVTYFQSGYVEKYPTTAIDRLLYPYTVAGGLGYLRRG